MKILFIGGTGNISRSVSQLCVELGHDLWLLNRGTTGVDIPGRMVDYLLALADRPVPFQPARVPA